jgi:tetratricopeptide (TPR) repeat protein
MNERPYIYKNDLYQEFKALEKASYREVIQYFEANVYKFQSLEVLQYAEILHAYSLSLFEMGLYHRYLAVVDELLELSISQNIIELDHEDVFGSSLFRKAASFYNLGERVKAEAIILELLRIYPMNEDARHFYRRLQMGKKQYSGFTRAATVVLLLSSALFITAELLIFRPFFKDWVSGVEVIRNVLFASGLGLYLLGELANRFVVHLRLKREVQLILKNKELKGSVAPENKHYAHDQRK